MMECITNLVNVTALQEEIEKARPTGDLDTVFNKYCKKRNIAMDCVTNFTKSIEPCLEEEEKKHKTVFTNIIENLLNFVCFKDGDQIACECFNHSIKKI